MNEKFIRKARKNGTSLAINIPTEITQILNIKEGDLVRVTLEKFRKNGEK